MPTGHGQLQGNFRSRAAIAKGWLQGVAMDKGRVYHHVQSCRERSRQATICNLIVYSQHIPLVRPSPLCSNCCGTGTLSSLWFRVASSSRTVAALEATYRTRDCKVCTCENHYRRKIRMRDARSFRHAKPSSFDAAPSLHQNLQIRT